MVEELHCDHVVNLCLISNCHTLHQVMRMWTTAAVKNSVVNRNELETNRVRGAILTGYDGIVSESISS